jgi:hypothetical protein
MNTSRNPEPLSPLDILSARIESVAAENLNGVVLKTSELRDAIAAADADDAVVPAQLYRELLLRYAAAVDDMGKSIVSLSVAQASPLLHKQNTPLEQRLNLTLTGGQYSIPEEHELRQTA